MKPDVINWIGKGADIAGAGAAPVAAAFLGDVSGGMIAQFGVLITKEIVDYVDRQHSEREHERSAAALITAFNKIKRRLDKGDEIRGDDFFRVRTGQTISAQTIIDGVLTKAKLQYEERKALLMGNLLANASFEETLSANDLSWMLACIDSLTYQHLLILAKFCSITPSGWNSNNISQIHTRDPVVLTQIEELRSRGLLSGHATFEVPIEISPTGRLLVECVDLIEELEWHGEHIDNAISVPVSEI